jgi:diguanylate cyclase (GGDEF)-like protein/PAS domain S-box-containing protein
MGEMPEYFVEIRESVTGPAGELAGGLVVQDYPEMPALLDDAPVAMLIVDADREIRYANQMVGEVAGCDLDELVGRDVDEVLHPAEPMLTRPASQPTGDDGLTGEFVLYRQDGARRHLEARSRPVEYHGEACGQVVLWDITERVAWEQQVVHRASHDPLTGLPNAWFASNYLHNELRKAIGPGPQMAVLFVDLDGFKAINDTFGHQVGDVVLRQTATRLKAAVSVAELTARLHGDEFLVLCRVANSIHAAHLAARVRRSLGLPIRVGRHTVRVTASVGIALTDGEASSADRLLRFADHRMYADKHHPATDKSRRDRSVL